MTTKTKTGQELWEIAKRRHLAKIAASSADFSATEKALRPEEQEKSHVVLARDNS